MSQHNDHCHVKKTHRDEKFKKNIELRLSKIEGQVRGINKMVQADSYCADVLTQIAAIESAISSVRNLILEDHLRCCVTSSIEQGDTEIITEVMEIIKRISK